MSWNALKVTEVSAYALIILLAAGCATEHPHEMLDTPQAGVTYELPIGYQAACRELLHATYRDFGEHHVRHELWTDIEEGQVYSGYIRTSGVDWAIQIKGEGPTRCRVVVTAINSFQRQRVIQCVDQALSRLKAGQ